MTSSGFAVRFAVVLAVGVLFAVAFFPYSPSFDRAAAEAARQREAEREDRADRDVRLVFVLVDALRYDLMGRGMPFTQSLVDKGQAALVHTKANSPTVTLPRVKALTTGTVPGFADIVLNFGLGGAEAIGESWLDQLAARHKTMHFFGDDTWLRLFPTQFARTDGTTSFYVHDTVEVDQNVTRHVLHELTQPDWDILVFHYLGLDHIGHLVGPASELMDRKLVEMDAVVGLVWETLKPAGSKRTLFVLCSDHGMTEMGNHGGSSDAETSAMALFAMLPPPETGSTANVIARADQVDVAPTIALLLGLGRPPLNNVGRVIGPVLEWIEPDEAKQQAMLRANALQLCSLWQLRRGQAAGHCEWGHDLDQLSQQLKNDSAATYPVRLLLACVAIALAMAAWSIARGVQTIIVLLPEEQRGLAGTIAAWQWIVQPLLLISSSFVEEEQELWAFATATMVVLVQLAQGSPLKQKGWRDAIMLLVVLRLLRAWNPAGVKWSHLPSLRVLLGAPSSWSVFGGVGWTNAGLATFAAFGLFALAIRGGKWTLGVALVAVALARQILSYPDQFPVPVHAAVLFLGVPQVWLERIVFAGCGLHVASKRTAIAAVEAFALVLLTVHRPHNTLAIYLCFNAALVVAPRWLRTIGAPAWLNAAVFYSLGQHFFFSLGNTNGIATIDLAGAYAGQTNFSVGVTGALLFAVTFSGPLLAQSGLGLLVDNPANRDTEPRRQQQLGWITVARTSAIAIYLVVMLLMQQHLFIWSVFAPKLLYLLALGPAWLLLILSQRTV